MLIFARVSHLFHLPEKLDAIETQLLLENQGLGSLCGLCYLPSLDLQSIHFLRYMTKRLWVPWLLDIWQLSSVMGNIRTPAHGKECMELLGKGLSSLKPGAEDTGLMFLEEVPVFREFH